jgi:hypothetical protein
MPVEHLTVEQALERLADAAKSGNRAKRRLANKLARMTAAQLRRVNPAVFARLGPAGLKVFAAASVSLRNLAPALPNFLPAKTEPLLDRLKRKWHFMHPLLKCLVVATVCAVVGVAAAYFSASVLKLIIGQQTEMIADGWPLCEKLDRDHDGCVYRTSSGTLTIDRIHVQTGLSPEDLVTSNPHLDWRFALPRGALIVVPRNISHPHPYSKE